MLEDWQYWDAYYRSSYPGGETLDVGTSHFNQGFSGYPTGPGNEVTNVTATSSSATVFSGNDSNVGPANS